MPCSGSRIRRPLRFAIAISFALAVSAVGLCQQSDTPESANPTHSAPSGLTAVAAIQESLISAIATAEPSVVAIARVRNEVLERQAGGASLPGRSPTAADGRRLYPQRVWRRGCRRTQRIDSDELPYSGRSTDVFVLRLDPAATISGQDLGG